MLPLGEVYVAKLGKEKWAFRLDVDREVPSEQRIEAVGKLLGNDLVSQGYPETLRLAHIICTFTANEVLAMQHFITRKCGLKMINSRTCIGFFSARLGGRELLMKLYRKEGNIVQILSFPNETVEKGDYLLVEDGEEGRALIVQVIDVQFATIPGVLEELLRSLPDGGELIQGEDLDPFEIAPHITYIQDASLLVAKSGRQLKMQS